MKFTTLLLTIIISSKLLGQDYGMVQVDSNLWVDQTEITNNEYRVFVNWVRDSIARRILFDSGLKEYGSNTNIDGSFAPNWKQTLDYSDTSIISVLESKGFWQKEYETFYSRKVIDVSNLNYRYINSQKVVIEINIYPDTTNFLDPFIDSNGDTIVSWNQDNFCNMYFWHPAYDDFPVVNINYSQATAFCHWRTKLYNDYAKEKRLKRIVKYTLPSIDNMYTISTKSSQLHQEAGKSIYWGGLLEPEPLLVMHRFYKSEAYYRKKIAKYLKKLGGVKREEQLQLMDLKYPYYIVSNEYNFHSPLTTQDCFGVPSLFAKDDNNLIYGMSGNAAEILIDKKVVGGSYLHSLEKCEIGELIEWNASNSSKWLGFRCVMYYIK